MSPAGLRVLPELAHDGISLTYPNVSFISLRSKIAMQVFIGTIQSFGFNFAPSGWALCNGQIMAITQNTALFSLIGTSYGGNGTSTFQLPNLQGRVPIHQGIGSSGIPYIIGESAGTENTTLLVSNMPAHNHLISVQSAVGTTEKPAGQFPALAQDAGGNAVTVYSPTTDNSHFAPTAVSLTGGSTPISNLQPYLCVSFCIALVGLFPSRN